MTARGRVAIWTPQVKTKRELQGINRQRDVRERSPGGSVERQIRMTVRSHVTQCEERDDHALFTLEIRRDGSKCQTLRIKDMRQIDISKICHGI